MQMVEFTKGHGTGNDFVIIPDPDGRLDLAPGVVAAVCHRRYGVGADGVLRVVRVTAHPDTAGRAAPAGAEWFMDYHNADGSVAEMCGNGVRVFARYLVDSGLAPAGAITLATRTGPVTATVPPTGTGDGSVTVALDPPRSYGESVARVSGRELAGVAVDCGNPHLVCAVPDQTTLAGLDLRTPPEVDAAFFPSGVNVELVAPGEGADAEVHVRMRVHERGVGETLSCGSGACAAAAVALRDAGLTRGTVAVDVPGGRLRLELTERSCALTGPAVLVARGTLDLGRLDSSGRLPVS